MKQEQIRNFCIIAHIDHGKSTLADRMLELTGTVEKRKMKKQLLDSMELEQEKGITIKLAPARMGWSHNTSQGTCSRSNCDANKLAEKNFVLNLIDTPGHVDFNYEVSRSLAAVEGAILLVDATQGVQAQTIGNLYLALEQNLTIIPVLNKIDLPAADVAGRTQELVSLIGCDPDEILVVSAKTGEGVEALLDAVVDRIPAPTGLKDSPARALVFDSFYDEFRGVVAYVRVVDGSFKTGKKLKMMASKVESEILDVGHLTPSFVSDKELETGQIGYVVSGQKEIEGIRVGDTMTLVGSTNFSLSSNDRLKSVGPSEIEPLPGYKEVKPMVFAGIFPKEGSEYNRLRDAMAKLKLSDAALSYEPEQSTALGFGLRCGFLGMLHLEIIKERLSREFDLELVVTVPSVAYKVTKTDAEEMTIKSPSELPERTYIDHIDEPWVKADLVTPSTYVGAVMELCQDRHAIYQNTEYLEGDRVILHYEIPLASVIVDFYDKLKSVTAGYASLNYEITDYRVADVVRMDILVAEEPVEALASLVYRDEAHEVGKKIVKTLKDEIPRKMFVIKLQAAVGGTIVAGERISAMRKDVTAKLYGGDVSRKRKLLEKQKKGKAKMMAMGKGKVDIPTDAYLKVLKR